MQRTPKPNLKRSVVCARKLVIVVLLGELRLRLRLGRRRARRVQQPIGLAEHSHLRLVECGEDAALGARPASVVVLRVVVVDEAAADGGVERQHCDARREIVLLHAGEVDPCEPTRA